MYPQRTIRSERKYDVSVPVKPFECDHYYKPFSYYLNGGSDPTGEHTDMSGRPSFDAEEHIAAGAGVDAFADPRTNFFDLVEQLGTEAAQSTADKIDAGQTVKQ